MKQIPRTPAQLISESSTGCRVQEELDIQSRRQLLFSARARFSSETQSVRMQAIDNIIEQNLALSESERGLSLRQIQDQRIVAMPDGTAVFPREDLEAGLKRLVASGRVVASSDDPPRYCVSDSVRTSVWRTQDSCEQRLAHIVGRLFKGAKNGAKAYAKPFMECLCFVFSGLGEAYVRQIRHEISAETMLDQPHVAKAFKKIKASYPFVEDQHFQAAVFKFFADQDPEFAALKWNLAQNYFVARCLGLDASGRLLSKEVFGEADIYLDTNVAIESLEPGTKHYRSFEALAKACGDLKIRLHVCQISVDELRKVVSYEREAIEKVLNRIPDETAPKIKGVLFPIYYRQKMAGENPNIDDLFECFSESSTMLKTFYNVEISDDQWFVDNLDAPETAQLAAEIIKAYENRPWRHKSKNAADHDALLLRWVRRERETNDLNAWIVTLDHSLPNFTSKSKEGEVPLAIRLDALLHWLSPVALQGDEGQDRAASIFSEALKYNLLPQENFFELGDFLAFAEWEWDTKELPAADVEGCIRCVKSAVPHLNPADPSDREKISREFNKYLRDPGRKYKGELARLEAMNADIVREKNETAAQLTRTREELEDKLSETSSALAAARSQILVRDLKSSALWRLGVIGLVWLVAELSICYVGIKLGEGENNFQKIKNAWELVALPLPCAVVATWFLLGQERIRALGWPFSKLLSGSSE